MQVVSPNNIKIYNLSQGKSLPEFLSDNKKRALLKKDVNLRKRIELIQDFSMPTVSTKVQMTKDGNYIFAAGTYKPRIRCFDVNQLSLKFERCLDSEVSAFEILSEDYSKVVLLLNDRYVEFHSQEGRWYRIRMPKFGRDLRYNPANCDLYLVGSGPEIYRLNLNYGRYLKSFITDAAGINVCDLNSHHNLLAVGTTEGKVECWDPRSRQRVGILDCVALIAEGRNGIMDCPEVTALKFKGPLHMSVGTNRGQVLMYDIRTSKPYVTKDHYYDSPIHSIDFNKENDLVISSDKKCVKLWDEKTGAAVTAIEPEHDINHMHAVHNSGLMFLANESSKIQTYFVPMLGPAPKWASFLDSLTEELEENPTQELYDDFKFVTTKELESLGLSNLKGSSLLRAYMHGYFIDIRLYQKAKAIANPFAYNEYRQKKIQERIEEERTNRVRIKKLPKINKGLAERLLQHADGDLGSGKKKKQKREAETLLGDARFKAMFENPDFEINEQSEEFQLLNPVITKKFEKSKRLEVATVDSDDEEEIPQHGDTEFSGRGGGSSWIEGNQKMKRILPKKKLEAQVRGNFKPKMYQLKDDAEFYTLKDLDKVKNDEQQERKKRMKASIEERIKENETENDKAFKRAGAKQTTYVVKKSQKQLKREEEQKRHMEDRRKMRRNAKCLRKIKP